MIISSFLTVAMILTNLTDIATAVSNGRQDCEFHAVGTVLAVSRGKSALISLADGKI